MLIDHGYGFLKFVSRSWYREKHTEKVHNELKEKFGDFYSSSEGGHKCISGKQAVKKNSKWKDAFWCYFVAV